MIRRNITIDPSLQSRMASLDRRLAKAGKPPVNWSQIAREAFEKHLRKALRDIDNY